MRSNYLPWLCLLLWTKQATYAQKPELVLPIGHIEPVTSVAISSNGRLILSGSEDNTIKLWDQPTGKLLRSLEGHSKAIVSVCFSPDGQLGLSGSLDNTIRLWSITTGKEIYRLNVEEGDIESIAFSHDGQSALSSTSDNTLKLWNVKTGEYRTCFISERNGKGDPFRIMHRINKGYRGEIETISFSSDGQLALSESADSTLILLNTKTAVFKNLIGHKSKIIATAFSPDSKLALSGSIDKTAKLWDVETGKLVRSFSGHDGDVNAVSFSPDGQRALTASSDTTIKLWDINTGRLLQSFKKHSDKVNAAIFSPDGRYILSCSSDNTLKLWDLSSGKLIRSFESHTYTSALKAIQFLPDGQALAFLFRDNSAKLWSVSKSKIIEATQAYPSTIESFAVSPNGQLYLSGSWGNTLQLYDLNQHRHLKTFEGHDHWAFLGNTKSVYLQKARAYLKKSYLYDREWLKKGWSSIERSDPWAHSWITSVSFSPDSQLALSGSSDDTLKLWDVNTGKNLRVLAGHSKPVTSTAFSPDGRLALSGSTDNTIKLWALNTGINIRTYSGHNDDVNAVAFSPNGQMVLSGSKDKTLKLWSVSSGKLLQSFEGNNSGIEVVTFSPDGRYIISGATDNTVKIWNVKSGQEIATIISVDSTDWLVTTASGLFDASPGAMKLMNYIVNDSIDLVESWKVIDIEQLKHRYYQPGLLPILMGYIQEKLRLVPTYEYIAFPPTIRLSVERDILNVKLQNRKGGIGKVSLNINGAEVIEDLRSSPELDSIQNTLMITLPLAQFANRFDSTNTIQVIAFNGAGWLTSRPETINYRPAIQRGAGLGRTTSATITDRVRLQAVVVGTSNIGLRFAHKDAEQIANGLRLVATELLGAENIDMQTLISPPGEQQITKAKILKALEAGQKTRPQDIFVFYLAGHGINHGGQDGDFYYLTAGATSADAGYLNDPSIRLTNALSSEEITRYLNLIPARKKLLILDVCAAGKGAERLLVAAREIPASQIRALDRLQSRTGFYVLAGSAADAVSYESNIYGQGLLTYALLQGMRGGKLRRDGDQEYLDVEQWLGYAVEQVPMLAKEIRGIQQPFFRGTQGQRSFDVGKVTTFIKEQIRIVEPKPVLLIRSFQEETLFDDLLSLTPTIEGALMDMSARSPDAPILYIEAKDYPGAFTLVGRYTVKNETVSVKCKVMKATKLVDEFVIKGLKTKLLELAQSILTRTHVSMKHRVTVAP